MIVFQVPDTVAGTVLIIDRIESQNYVTNVSGWTIKANGDAEFFNLVSRGSFIGGTVGGKRVEINGSTIPGGIAFFTGAATETAPGVVQPSVSGSALQLDIMAPVATGSGTRPYLHLATALNDSVAELGADSAALLVGALYMSPAREIRTDEVWHTVGAGGEPAFQGNWAVQGASPVQFAKDVAGRVQVRGQAAEPVASSSIIFTLPAGYRPSQNMSWAIKCNNDSNSVAWVRVTTAGAITPIGNTAFAKVQTVLDAISFSTLL